MTRTPGPALDPEGAEPLPAAPRHWWEGERWTSFAAAVGTRLRPRAEPPTPAGTPAPKAGVGFPFVRPRTHDWVFWWAMALGLVALVWLAFDVTNRYGGFNLSAWLIDGAIGLPLIFVVLVLPVAAVRALVRGQRTRFAARRNAA